MTEAFRSPPPSQDYPGQAAVRQEVTDTVQRIMGEGIAPAKHASTAPSGGLDDTSTTDVATDQASQVADTAKQAGTQVAGTVKDQAGQVTAKAGQQAKQLLSQAQSELSDQAGATQQRVSEGLHALADELHGMAKNSDQEGPATDLARQAADKAHQAAGWLADRDPGALLDEVRSFARRKPGAYLAIALGAGILAGRLTRGLTAPTDDAPSSPTSSTTDPTDTSTGLLGRGPTRYDGSEPVSGPLGSIPPALGAALPQTPAPTGGFGATGAFGDPRGEVTP
jgi:uncharacterized protein YjbJ (UPF0337 family)